MALYFSVGAALNDDLTGTEPVDWRKTLEGLVSGPGVLPGADLPLVEGVVGAMSYQVNAATWATPAPSGGVHLWGNDGPILVTTDAAPGTGERIDIVYALHTSNGESGATVSAPVVDVAKGAVGSPAVAPSVPAGAIELARNTMGASAVDTAGSGNSISQTATRAHLGVGWQPYTPVLTNVTLGNGTLIGRFRDDGGTVHFTVVLIAGSTTAITGLFQVGLPVPASAPSATVGSGMRTSDYKGVFFRASVPTSVYVYDAADGAAWSSGTNFDSGDSLRLSGMYERA